MSLSIPAALKRMHPFLKLIVCALFSLLGLLAAWSTGIDTLSRVIICWNIFSFTMLSIDWYIFFSTGPSQIHEFANKEDEGRVAVFIIVLIATFASMLAVALLLITGSGPVTYKALHITIALAGMILSWSLVHTLFTIHYAHLFYGDSKKANTITGGLEFPGTDLKPDFMDFAYFSFVLGMTFQVSDIQITSKKMRRLALFHGLLSFAYNTVIVALSINTIAGLNSR